MSMTYRKRMIVFGFVLSRLCLILGKRSMRDLAAFLDIAIELDLLGPKHVE